MNQQPRIVLTPEAVKVLEAGGAIQACLRYHADGTPFAEYHPRPTPTLEEAFWDWWAANRHALDLGGTGDLVALRNALNGAAA